MERLKGEVWRTVWGLGFLVVLPVESKSLRPVSRTFAVYDAIKPYTREACIGTLKLTREVASAQTLPKYSVQLAIFPPIK